MSAKEAEDYSSRLTELARQLNAFAGGLKDVRLEAPKQSKTAREDKALYNFGSLDGNSETLFSYSGPRKLDTQTG